MKKKNTRELVSKLFLTTSGDDVNVDAYVEFTRSQYGEDADGNRGVLRYEITGLSELTAYTLDGDEYELKDEDIQNAMDELEEEFLNGK